MFTLTDGKGWCLGECQMAEGSLGEWQALDRGFGDQDLVLSVLMSMS